VTQVFNLLDGELSEERDFRRAGVASQFGARLTGLSVYELSPGHKTWPYHFELNEEEWVLVVSGEVTVRTPEGDVVLRAGETMCFPPGPAGAHALRNESDAVSRFAMPSSVAQLGDSTVYPDSNKVKVSGPGGFRTIVSLERELDYWDGEE
jgi:uncharacterized cupin superfamily protein